MGSKIVLSPKQEEYLVKHFKHTKNVVLAEKLGISQSSLHRLARNLGLKKTPQFMKKCQKESAAKAREYNLMNGVYPPKGTIVPGSEKYRFKKGERPVDRIGEKRERERIRKSAETRRATLKRERARVAFGLKQKTKLRIHRQSRRRTNLRWYLKKRGYTLDEELRIAYYDEDTKRATRLEKKGTQYYEFRPKGKKVRKTDPSKVFVWKWD